MASACLPPATVLVSPADELGIQANKEIACCLHCVGVAPSSSGKSTVLQFVRQALMAAIRETVAEPLRDFIFGSGTTPALLKCLAKNNGSVLAIADELQVFLGGVVTGTGLSAADMGAFLSVLAGNGFVKQTTAARDSKKTEVLSVAATNLSSVSMTQPSTFSRMVEGDGGACLERGALQRMLPFIVRPINALVGPADAYRMAHPETTALSSFLSSVFVLLLRARNSKAFTQSRASKCIVLPPDSAAAIADVYNTECRFRAGSHGSDDLDMHLSRAITQRTAKLSVALALLDFAASSILEVRAKAVGLPPLSGVFAELPQPVRREDGRFQFVDVDVTTFVSRWCTGRLPAATLLAALRREHGDRRAGSMFFEKHLLSVVPSKDEGAIGIPINSDNPCATQIMLPVSMAHVRLGNALAGMRLRMWAKWVCAWCVWCGWWCGVCGVWYVWCRVCVVCCCCCSVVVCGGIVSSCRRVVVSLCRVVVSLSARCGVIVCIEAQCTCRTYRLLMLRAEYSAGSTVALTVPTFLRISTALYNALRFRAQNPDLFPDAGTWFR